MSYVLSTTNHSVNGFHAAEYAAGLALALKCPLRLVYAHVVPVTFGEVPLPVMPADEARRIAEEQATAARDVLQAKFPELEIQTEVAYGDLADVLEETANNDLPWLTVIGNDEEPDSEGLIGVYASRMLRQAGHPVLAVPHDVPFSIPRHVGIAVDYRCIREGIPVELLASLSKQLGFRISILHVLTEDSEPMDIEDTRLWWQLGGVNASYVELPPPDESVDEAIARYAVGIGEMDWIALVPHHYNFWEGLFHRSHTARMLHVANRPILAIHSENNSD